MSTRNDLLEIVNLIKDLPNSPIKDRESFDNTLKLFSAVLEDLPTDMLKAATVQYCSEGNPFFPMPGVLRDKAMELQMLALGIPTPAEAWAMVVNGLKHVQSVFCEEGAVLRDAVAGDPPDYWQALNDYGDHMKACNVCAIGGLREVYDHTAVEETVKMLGGREVILTNNPTADRARFIEAYREVVSRERMKMAMTPKVAAYIETVKPVQLPAGAQIKQLSERLSK